MFDADSVVRLSFSSIRVTRDAGFARVAVTRPVRMFLVRLYGLVLMARCKTVDNRFLLRVGVTCSAVVFPSATMFPTVNRKELRVVIDILTGQSGWVAAITRIALPGIPRHAHMGRIDHGLAVVVARETREERAIGRIGVTRRTVGPRTGMSS